MLQQNWTNWQHWCFCWYFTELHLYLLIPDSGFAVKTEAELKLNTLGHKEPQGHEETATKAQV